MKFNINKILILTFLLSGAINNPCFALLPGYSWDGSTLTLDVESAIDWKRNSENRKKPADSFEGEKEEDPSYDNVIVNLAGVTNRQRYKMAEVLNALLENKPVNIKFVGLSKDNLFSLDIFFRKVSEEDMDSVKVMDFRDCGVPLGRLSDFPFDRDVFKHIHMKLYSPTLKQPFSI